MYLVRNDVPALHAAFIRLNDIKPPVTSSPVATIQGYIKTPHQAVVYEFPIRQCLPRRPEVVSSAPRFPGLLASNILLWILLICNGGRTDLADARIPLPSSRRPKMDYKVIHLTWRHRCPLPPFFPASTPISRKASTACSISCASPRSRPIRPMPAIAPAPPTN